MFAEVNLSLPEIPGKHICVYTQLWPGRAMSPVLFRLWPAYFRNSAFLCALGAYYVFQAVPHPAQQGLHA